MSTKTTAAVSTSATEPFELREVELDDLQPHEVLVRLVATGVCHTDISAKSGTIPYPLPGVLGHEGAGIIERIGSQVRRVRSGDKVVMTFTSCGNCRHCRSGSPALCDHHLQWNLLGGRRADGTTTVRLEGNDINAHFFGQSSFSRLAIVDERSLIPLPAETTEEDMITLAPLGCGFQTGAGAVLKVLKPGAGDRIVITGAGAVGLAAVMAAALTPAAEIIVVDLVPERLELAKSLGATQTINAREEDVKEQLGALTAGRGIEYALETTGNVAVLETLLDSLAIGGTCGIVGAPIAGSRASFDVNAFLPGRKIVGITIGDSEPQSFIPELLNLYRAGRFPIDRLETTYPFESIEQAVADAVTGRTIKPVLIF